MNLKNIINNALIWKGYMRFKSPWMMSLLFRSFTVGVKTVEDYNKQVVWWYMMMIVKVTSLTVKIKMERRGKLFNRTFTAASPSFFRIRLQFSNSLGPSNIILDTNEYLFASLRLTDCSLWSITSNTLKNPAAATSSSFNRAKPGQESVTDDTQIRKSMSKTF